MTSIQRLLLGGALLAAAAFGYVWLTQGSSQGSDGLSGEASEIAPGAETEAATLEGASTEESALTPSLSVETEKQRDVIQGAQRVVQARIQLPENGALEPGLQVYVLPKDIIRRGSGREPLARLRAGEDVAFPWASAPVDARGVAPLPILKTIEEPVAILQGRYLSMERGVPIEPEATEVDLPTAYGACLEVELVNRPDDVTEGSIRLMAFRSTGMGGFASRTGSLDQREYRGLDAELTWMVQMEMAEHYSPGKFGIELEAGQTKTVQVEIQPGAWISGTVADDSGQPMADVDVQITNLVPWMNMMGSGSSTKTDEEGKYTLGPLGPGKKTVETEEKGYVDFRSKAIELALGERREGVRLTLSQGLSLSGQVLWPDGKPADDALVVAEERNQTQPMGPWGGGGRRDAGRTNTDGQGRFTITGLEPGKLTLKASLRSPGKGSSRATYRAEQSAVEAGSQNLILRLEAPLLLSGQVLDDLGKPISEFTVIGRSALDGGPNERERFEDEEGRFAFERLGPGTWFVRAEAKGYEQLEPIELELPAAAAQPITLRLQRRATIAGVVLDAANQPLAGARVQASQGQETDMGWPRNTGPSSETDEEGRFTVEDVAPGLWKVTASNEGWADSESQTVELASGVPVEDLVLVLRRGGTIRGRVIGEDGRPVSGQRVMWGSNAWGWGAEGETRTDGAGRFTFENITPGEWMVTATASMEELGERMRDVDDPSDFSSMMSDMLTESVTVFDGEVTEVQLGGDPLVPVTVRGRVMQGEDPVGGAQVYAVTEGQAIMQGMKSNLSDEEGRYSLTVDRPGAYIISASKGRMGVETFVDVPQAEEFAHDLVIPSGGIAGRVELPSGEPAAGIRLNLERLDGLGTVRWSGDMARTDVDGGYRFESLQPGIYMVRVNANTWTGGPNEAYATENTPNIRVGQEGFTRMDFQLQKPGTISGRVVGPDGQPVEGASLFFRDSQGMLVATVSDTMSDAAGRFEKSGLGAGSYTVVAKSEWQASVESAPIAVRAGVTSNAELRMQRGTSLRVTLRDLEEREARLRVEVFDEDGRDLARMWTLKALSDVFKEGAVTTEQRVGPLAPGEYRVRASTADGRFEEMTVRVSGQAEDKPIVLTLKP